MYIILAILIILIIIGVGMYFYFYREGNIPMIIPDKNMVYSPGYGKIISISASRLNPEYNEIRVVLNVADIHYQYSPVSGYVKSTKHIEGQFNPVYFFEKTDYNERQETRFINENDDEIILEQVAGQLARRIDFYKKENDKVNVADKVGLIHFGSMLRIHIPRKYKILVENSQKITAGIPLAKLQE